MNTVSAPPGPVVSITCIMVFMPATLLFTPELPSLTWGPDAGDRHRGAVDSGTGRSQAASAPVRAAGHDEPAPGSKLRSVQDEDMLKRRSEERRVGKERRTRGEQEQQEYKRYAGKLDS